MKKILPNLEASTGWRKQWVEKGKIAEKEAWVFKDKPCFLCPQINLNSSFPSFLPFSPLPSFLPSFLSSFLPPSFLYSLPPSLSPFLPSFLSLSFLSSIKLFWDSLHCFGTRRMKINTTQTLSSLSSQEKTKGKLANYHNEVWPCTTERWNIRGNGRKREGVIASVWG